MSKATGRIHVEKVLFASVNINALGVVLESDARGKAAVVKSMLTPLHVELSLRQGNTFIDSVASSVPPSSPSQTQRTTAHSEGSLEVGDVLIAINGQLLSDTPHSKVLDLLNIDCFSSEGMLVLCFLDPSSYYRDLRQGILTTQALSDPFLFGRLEAEKKSWRDYLPSWPFSREDPDTSTSKSNQAAERRTRNPQRQLSEDSVASTDSRRGQGEAYLKFSSGQYRQALAVYTSVLEREPLNHTVRISRSMCFLRLGDTESALRDALTCCALKPEWPMPYMCQGAALETMGNPEEACNAYICGLIVDPVNEVLRKHLNALFAAMRWECRTLDGRNVMGTVASAVLEREEWGADMIVDRILLYKDKAVCKAHLVEMAPLLKLTSNGQYGSISIRIGDAIAYHKALSEGNAPCELFNDDEILTLNGSPVKSIEEFHRNVEHCKGVVIVGILSGARIAANKLLEEEYTRKAEVALGSMQGSGLFVVIVSGCGSVEANGTYVPQELHYGSYVFENSHGCLLSIEKARGEGLWKSGWVIGHKGRILYAGVLVNQNESSGPESPLPSVKQQPFALASKSMGTYFVHRDDKEFLETIRKVRWRVLFGEAPGPRIERTSHVPSLGFFIGGSDDELTASEQGLTDLEDWTADLQILAIKGYAFRTAARNEWDTSMLCYSVVEDQVEALLGDIDTDTDEEEEWRSGQQESRSVGILHLDTTEPDLSRDPSGNQETLDAGLRTAKESYLEESKRESELTLRLVLIRVLIGKAQCLIEQGNVAQALLAAESACQSAENHNLGPYPMAFYYKAVALAALDRRVEALQASDAGLSLMDPSLNGTSFFRKLSGLKEELKNQIQEEVSESERVDVLKHAKMVQLKSIQRHHVPSSPTTTTTTTTTTTSTTTSAKEQQKEVILASQASGAEQVQDTDAGRSKGGEEVEDSHHQPWSCLLGKCVPGDPGEFNSTVKKELCRGYRVQRLASEGNANKPKLLHISPNGSNLLVSTVSKMHEVLGPKRGARAIPKDEVVGFVSGKVVKSKDGWTVQDSAADSNLSVLLQDGSLTVFTASSPATRNEILSQLAAWRQA